MDPFTLRQLSYGVYVISTLDGERPTGCVANSTMQITSDPATIAVSINHNNFTNECIQKTGKFSVSILGEKIDPGLIGTFGFSSGRDIDKYENVKYELKESMPVILEACGYLVCEVVDKLETDTHTIFLGKMVDAEILNKQTPMSYSYYHSVVKGKSPKNAPTYIAEEEVREAEKIEAISEGTYYCSICGYTYEGRVPFEQLADSYTCPICKQPKSVFVKK